jgi:hypothetical protein
MNTGCVKILTAAGVEVAGVAPLGPMGVVLTVRHHARALTGSLIATQTNHPQAADPLAEWLHASLAWEAEMPSYADLVLLHRAVFGRKRYAYQVFAPQHKHINGSVRDGLPAHEHALHLWGKVNGTPVLPEFGWLGHI